MSKNDIYSHYHFHQISENDSKSPIYNVGKVYFLVDSGLSKSWTNSCEYEYMYLNVEVIPLELKYIRQGIVLERSFHFPQFSTELQKWNQIIVTNDAKIIESSNSYKFSIEQFTSLVECNNYTQCTKYSKSRREVRFVLLICRTKT